MTPSLFTFLATLTIAAALGVVLNRNPVRSAMCLVGTLFLLAVVFVFLDAHLVAALQVLVYAGAIMVLFLFVIMLLNLQAEPYEPGSTNTKLFAAATVAALAILVGAALVAGVAAPKSGGEHAVTTDFGTTTALSDRLFTTYLLPFEITSLLLLVAIIGAVVMAKRRID